MDNICNGWCRGCRFRGSAAGTAFCQYILMTGKRRGCPAGTGCRRKEVNVIQSRTDPAEGLYEIRMQLYRAGLSDGQISKRLGISRHTIASWRRRHALAGNGVRDVAR